MFDIYKLVFDKKVGSHQDNFITDFVVLEPNEELNIEIYLPDDIIYILISYMFDVDYYNMFSASCWHDGQPAFKDLIITDSFVAYQYSVPEIIENSIKFKIKNIDSEGRTGQIRIQGIYKSYPKQVYNILKSIVESPVDIYRKMFGGEK